MVKLISPYEISEMFKQKFDGFDFAQPYFLGEFRDNPNKGHITIGVRTPWYDFEYFVYSKASFWVGIENYKSAEDVLKRAVGHLNAAVAMQNAPDGRGAQRFDIGDINKYQADPEGYGEKSEHEVEQPYNNRDFDVYVHHDSEWSDSTLMEAERVHYLCGCESCKKDMKRIIKAREEQHYND